MNKDRIYNFANYDVTQSYNLEASQMNRDEINDTQNFDQSHQANFSIENEADNYQDLGVDLYNFIVQLYYEKNKVKMTRNPQVLYDFFQLLRKQQVENLKNEENRMRTAKDREEIQQKQYMIQELMDKDDSELNEKERFYVAKEKKQRKLREFIDLNVEDVRYTLYIHSHDKEKSEKQDQQISQYFEKDLDKFHEEQQRKKNQKVNVKEAVNRLYYSSQTANTQIDFQKCEWCYRKKLAHSIIDDYFKNGLEQDEKNDISDAEKNFRHPKKLKEYWPRVKDQKELIQSAIDECFPANFSDQKKNEALSQVKESKFKEKVIFDDIDKYFRDVFTGFIKQYDQSCGYLPEEQKKEDEQINKNESQKVDKSAKYQNYYKSLKNKQNQDPMIQFMKFYDKLDKRKREFLDVDFEGRENFENQLREFYAQWNEERRQEEIQREKTQQEEEQRRKKYLQKKVFNKQFEPKKTPLEQLMLPKDKYKSGQVMLELHTKFPKDRILNEMIVQEFKQNRLNKYGLEYDVFDSDEEDQIKQRKTAEERITPENVYMIYEQRIQEKIDDLSIIFRDRLDFYQSTNSEEIRKLIQEKKQINEENKKLLRHLNQAAKQFIEMRKDRKKKTREQKQKGLNEFVSALFQQCEQQYKKVIEKQYPAFRYGLAKNSAFQFKPFPPKFKKDFFEIVRAYARTSIKKQKVKKLPFWAPPSFNIFQKTLNKKIEELSRDYLANQYDKDRPDTSVWDNKVCQKEREQIMMKFEEAQNCTFNPGIGYRMNKRNKFIFLQSKINSPLFLEKPKGFDLAVQKMGENFKDKYPWLYKKGIIKKAWFLIQNGDIPEAYSSLCDNFHIKSIITHFNPKVTKFLQDDPDSQFNFEKIGKKEKQEEKLKRENFENPRNRELLKEIYDQLMFMEANERDVIKKANLFLQRLSEDQRNQIQMYKMKKRMIEQLKEQKGDKEESEEIRNKKIELQMIMKQSEGEISKDNKQKLQSQKEEKMLELIKLRSQQNQDSLIHSNDEQKSLRASKKQGEYDGESSSRYSSATQSTYASRRELVKNIMCPLGNSCPGYVGPRWHVSSIKSCVPIGANCVFAHTMQELKFNTEIKAKKSILFDYLKSVIDKGFTQSKLPAWNPAGNKFSSCLGCSQKTACSECKFKTFNKNVILQLRNATQVTNSKICKTQSFKNKQENKKITSGNLTFKLGCLQKANIFYKLKRYQEAFDVISKAIEQIRKEVETDRIKQLELENKWRKALNLGSFGEEITAETILMHKSLPKADQHDLQKLELYGIKTGIIGNKKPNTNEFLNYQIEQTYLKIERALKTKDENVDLMKRKIGELEELQEMIEQRDANLKSNPNMPLEEIEEDVVIDTQNMDKEEIEDKLREKRLKVALRKVKTKMCPNILNNGVCPLGKRCRFAHWANELLLVKPAKLIKNLRNAIEQTEEVKLFQFWNPSGNNIQSCGGCGLCNFCQTKRTNEKIYELFRFATQSTNNKIRQKESYQNKVRSKKQRHLTSDRKYRLLMKTKILVGQGYHQKAFDMIMKAIKLIDMNYKKDELLNYEIEQMYLSIKKYLDEKYQDLVYMNIQIDELKKIQEQAEIVEQQDRSIKTQPPKEIKKTKSHYILDKEANVDIAYRYFKNYDYEEGQKLIDKVIEDIDKEPDVEEDPFNATLKQSLKNLGGFKKNKKTEIGEENEEDDYNSYEQNMNIDDDNEKGDQHDALNHPLMRFRQNKQDLYSQAMDSLRSDDNNDPMIKDQNKQNAIYLLKLAYNYIKIEKQDLVYNQEVNKKARQVKELISKQLNEKNRNYREKQQILESAEKCIEGQNFNDGFDIILNAIAIIRKEKYVDEEHTKLNKRIDTVYSVLKQGKYNQSLREKPILTPISEPFKEREENETRISAFRNLKHVRDRTLEEKQQQSALDERVFRDPKTIGMVYPNSSIYQIKNAMFKIDQNIQHGVKYPSFVPPSQEQASQLFGEKDRLQRLDEKTLWQQKTILNTQNKDELSQNPFVRKDDNLM
ncbi:hypothetical protein ABPG72_013259 [Tetrahymena utriculariae]